MRHNRTEKKWFKEIADELGLPYKEVSRAVGSFFGCINSYARKLPFDNVRKIYRKDAFDGYGKVYNIPFIGRIGPAYSRYLIWRRNESRNVVQVSRCDYAMRLTGEDIEKLATKILSGNSISLPKKRKGNEMYNRVWIVGTDGKKSARQVIPKTIEEDV